MVDLGRAVRCVANNSLRHPLKNLSLALNCPRVSQAELVWLVNPDNPNHITATNLPAKWKLTRILMVKKVTIAPECLTLDSPII
ncbi:MAG: hypothetical protein WDM80_08285 [Limisphaerales bacterium]